MASPDKGRHAYHPSKYGELLVSLPLSLESAIFVVRGGIAGYVRESIILGAIMDTTPFPIIQPFGQAFQVGLCNSTSDFKLICVVHGQILFALLATVVFLKLFSVEHHLIMLNRMLATYPVDIVVVISYQAPSS